MFFILFLSFICQKTIYSVNPIEDGPFRGCLQKGGAKRSPLPKICHTYPPIMKLGTAITYLKKIQKIYKSRDTLPEFW